MCNSHDYLVQVCDLKVLVSYMRMTAESTCFGEKRFVVLPELS